MKAKPTLRPVPDRALSRRAALALALALLLALAPALAACGKRGPPEPPEGDNTYPGVYPSPSTYPPQ